MTLQVQDRIVLSDLILRIGEAESQRHEAFLQQILADDLRFRRARGAVVDKITHCNVVTGPPNTYAYSYSDVFQVFGLSDSAVVSLLVWAKGIREKGTPGKTAFSRAFRNLRIFCRDAAAVHGRLCHFWFNNQVATQIGIEVLH